MISTTEQEVDASLSNNSQQSTHQPTKLPAPIWLKALIMAMFFGCLIIPKAFGGGVALLMLLALGVSLQQLFFKTPAYLILTPYRLSTQQKIICFAIGITGVVSLISLSFTDQSYWTGNRIDYPVRYLLAIPLFLYLSHYSISSRVIFLACCLGSLAAGVQSIYEKYGLNLVFVSGQAGHHILFGNISALMGIMTFSLIPFQPKLSDKLLGSLAVAMAILACLCSGSRGAIIGLLCLLLISIQLWRLYLAKTNISSKTKILMSGSLLLLLAVVFQLDDFRLTERMVEAYKEVKHYALDQALVTLSDKPSTQPFDTVTAITPNYMSSVGARLEMWQAAGILFTEKPLLGHGPKTFIDQGQRLIDEGKVRDFRLFYHPHNDVMNALASTGILGLLALILLLGVPLAFFIRAALSSSDHERAFGFAGTILCAGFIIQGLTETLFDRQLAIVFYLMMICTLLSQIHQYRWQLLSNCFTGEEKKIKVPAQPTQTFKQNTQLTPSLLSHTASSARIKLIFGLTFALFGLFFLITLFYHPFDESSSWLLEQSYWLAKEGSIRSYFFTDLLQYDQQLWLTDKLLVWMGSLLIKTVGYHPQLLQLIGLLGFGLCIGAFYYFAKTLTQRYHTLLSTLTLWLLLCTFLISSALIAEQSFIFSAHTLVMALGLLCFLALEHGLANSKPWFIWLAGLLAGLSLLAQLYGVIYIVAGLCVLIWYRQWRWLKTFIFGAALSASLYWIDIILAGDFNGFVLQLKGNIALLRLDTDWLYPLSALTEHKRYFRTEASFSWVLFLLLVFVLGRKQISQTPLLKRLAVFSLSAAIMLSFIAAGKTEKQLLLLWPMSICLCTALLPPLLRHNRHRKPVIALFVFYLICQGYAFTELWHQYRQPEIVMQHIEKQLPTSFDLESARIVTPLALIHHLKPTKQYRSYKLLNIFRQQSLTQNDWINSPKPLQSLLATPNTLVILPAGEPSRNYATAFDLRPLPVPATLSDAFDVLISKN